MMESEDQISSNSSETNGSSNQLSKVRQFVPALVVGAILVVIGLIYHSRYPFGYVNSRMFDENIAKWQALKIVHYRMSVNPPYDYSCYSQLSMPLTVEVKDNEVVSVVDAQGQIFSYSSDHSCGYYYQFFTVPKLFSYVHQYYLKKPPLIQVSYDTKFGFPSSIYINPYTEPCCQEFRIDVRDFQTLP